MKKQCPYCHISLLKLETDIPSLCPICKTKLKYPNDKCHLCGWAKEKSRYIPKNVQREVWKRDQGRCVECGSNERLEFDHIIPYSKKYSTSM